MLLYLGSWHAVSSFSIGASKNVLTPVRGLMLRGGCLASVPASSTQLQATTTFNAVNSNKTTNPLVLLFSAIRMFFFSLIRMFTGKMIERTDSELKQGIAHFYDESSQIWLDVWGEHMHHGKKYHYCFCFYDNLDDVVTCPITYTDALSLITATPAIFSMLSDTHMHLRVLSQFHVQ